MLASQYTERGGWTGYGYVIFLIFVDDSKWWISFFFFLYLSPLLYPISLNVVTMTTHLVWIATTNIIFDQGQFFFF